MSPDLSAFDAENEAMATELVEKIDRAIALAEACAEHSPDHNDIIKEGRAALVEVASFFEVTPPADTIGRATR